MITVQSMHRGQCSAQVSDLKSSLKPVMSTETALRDIGKDRTKSVTGAASQGATAQPDVKFATSKLTMASMAG